MLIVIEGCVGAGKSTVARGLAACRSSKLLLEKFESNPFLQAFYKDPIENATETEFAFLLLHFHQLKRESDIALRSEVIADFHLGKDNLYADLNLKDLRARRLFGELYELCLEKTPRPDILIFLSASTDTIIERIRRRERDFELDIDPSYYAVLNATYEQFFKNYSEKKLRVPMDEWDFVKDSALYERLSSLVDRELKTK
jgi:deoxyadenosine/deoxycytidine kinase